MQQQREKHFLYVFSDHDQKHFLIFGSYICASEFNASFYMVGIHLSIPEVFGVVHAIVFAKVENEFFSCGINILIHAIGL